MAVRPVEFSSSLPKLTEIGRLEQAKEGRWQAGQQQFAAELQQRSRQRQAEVGETEAGLSVREEGQQEKPGGKRRRGQKRPPNEKEPETKESIVGSRLDVRT